MFRSSYSAMHMPTRFFARVESNDEQKSKVALVSYYSYEIITDDFILPSLQTGQVTVAYSCIVSRLQE